MAVRRPIGKLMLREQHLVSSDNPYGLRQWPHPGGWRGWFLQLRQSIVAAARAGEFDRIIWWDFPLIALRAMSLALLVSATGPRRLRPRFAWRLR